MTTLIYTHQACFNHRPGPHHPESPERLQAVLQALKTPEFAAAVWRDAPLGSFEQVLHIHTPDYVETVQALSPANGYRAPVRALMGWQGPVRASSLQQACWRS